MCLLRMLPCLQLRLLLRLLPHLLLRQLLRTPLCLQLRLLLRLLLRLQHVVNKPYLMPHFFCRICTTWARLLVVPAVQDAHFICFVGVFIHAHHDGVGDLLGRGLKDHLLGFSPRVWLHLLSHEEGNGGLAGKVQ